MNVINDLSAHFIFDTESISFRLNANDLLTLICSLFRSEFTCNPQNELLVVVKPGEAGRLKAWRGKDLICLRIVALFVSPAACKYIQHP